MGLVRNRLVLIQQAVVAQLVAHYLLVQLVWTFFSSRSVRTILVQRIYRMISASPSVVSTTREIPPRPSGSESWCYVKIQEA